MNQTADLNMEVELLLRKFTEFRKTANAMDVTLFNNLQSLVDTVDNFLDSNPKLIEGLPDAKGRVNFEKENLERLIVCQVCEDAIGIRFKDVQKHVQRPQHKMNLKGGGPILLENGAINIKAKKGTKKQIVESQNLPKKLKTMMVDEALDWLRKAVQEANALKNIPQYSELENSILQLVKKEYPKAKAYAFGSRVNGMGSKTSDIDVFVDVDNTFNTYNESRDDKVKRLRKVRALMQNEKLEWKNMIAIEDARVPILRTFNAALLLDVDISFSNGLGSCNSCLIEYFFNLQPLCNKLCIYLKKWLKLSGLHNNISTYTFVLMVIFYLQFEKLLPSVQTLQNDISPLEIGPWMANFAQKSLDELKIPYVEDSDQKVMTHLKKFFDLYVRLPLKRTIISPYLGNAVDRNDLKKHSKYLERYFKYIEENPNNGLVTDKPFCVQDPLELNHNVAKGIPERLLALMQHYFKLSAQILQTTLVVNNKTATK